MTKIMGVLNLTPDSFSDGGLYNESEIALTKAMQLVQEGAAIIDIGGESTKPGSKRISAIEEWSRIENCLKALLNLSKQGQEKFLVSVDTIHDDTALKAARLGCGMLNNIKAFYSDECMHKLASVSNLQYVASHTVADPEIMQSLALTPENVIGEIERFFDSSYQKLTNFGFDVSRIFLDPGIGFGKTVAANLMILAKIQDWSRHYPLCVGISRKSFLGKLFSIENPLDRDPVSKVLEFAIAVMGAKIIRTHDVAGLLPLLSAVEGVKRA